MNKFLIFVALGIPEDLRHDGARVAIFTWVDDDYVERAESHGMGFRFLMQARMTIG